MDIQPPIHLVVPPARGQNQVRVIAYSIAEMGSSGSTANPITQVVAASRA